MRPRIVESVTFNWVTRLEDLLSERLACSEGFPIAPGDCNWTDDWPGEGVGLANRRRFYFLSRAIPHQWHPTPTWLAGNVGGGRNQELAVERPSASQSLQLRLGFCSGLQGNAVKAAPGPFAATRRPTKGSSNRKENGFSHGHRVLLLLHRSLFGIEV